MGRVKYYIAAACIIAFAACQMYKPIARAANVVGSATFQAYTSIHRITGIEFGNYTSDVFKQSHFSTYSANRQTEIDGKVDSATYNAAIQSINSSVSTKLPISTFNEYGVTVDAALATKTPLEDFKAYTSSKKGVTRGETGASGFDGRDALPYRCSVSVGTTGMAAVTYDADGLNPSVSTLGPFFAWLYEGSSMITPTAYEWYAPTWRTQLVYPPTEAYGAQIKRQYFEPRVQAVYSSVRSNNYVSVQMRFSSTIIPYGVRYCEASFPITVTKAGAQGAKGDASVAQVTANAVYGAFSSNRSDLPFVLRSYTSGRVPKLVIKDSLGNVRNWTDALGYQSFQDANGYVVVRTQTDGTIALLKNDVTRLTLSNSGTVTVYRNGSPVYEIYSTGRWKGPEGYPTTVTKQIPYVTQSGFRGYTTMGGSSSATLPNPYTLPSPKQTFRSASGKVRFEFYTAGRLVIY